MKTGNWKENYGGPIWVNGRTVVRVKDKDTGHSEGVALMVVGDCQYVHAGPADDNGWRTVYCQK